MLFCYLFMFFWFSFPLLFFCFSFFVFFSCFFLFLLCFPFFLFFLFYFRQLILVIVFNIIIFMLLDSLPHSNEWAIVSKIWISIMVLELLICSLFLFFSSVLIVFCFFQIFLFILAINSTSFVIFILHFIFWSISLQSEIISFEILKKQTVN